MEKTIGNYTGQPNRDFPLDCETLASLAGNQAMAEILGNICGDKTILLGCELNAAATSRAEGYIFLRTQDYPEGEVLRWTGGAVGGGMHVETVDVSVTADGYQYPKAYTRRMLVPGMGRENYSWDGFAELSTNRELARRLAGLEEELSRTVGEPIGTIKMWPSATPPENYLLCDGGAIPNEDGYSSLRAIVGNNTPDLRGRFIVGYNSADTDYDAIGKTDGLKKVTLTEDEIPSHTHDIKVSTEAGKELSGSKEHYYVQGSGGVLTSTSTGGGHSHENRPPYYVLAYIIKAK